MSNGEPMTNKHIFLHLSDLHFGDENETNAAKRKNTLRELIDTVAKLPDEWKPQSIVISGDIGYRGKADDYRIAKAWLNALLKKLDLSNEDIIPVPGNHDINLNQAATVAVPGEHITADQLLNLDRINGSCALQADSSLREFHT